MKVQFNILFKKHYIGRDLFVLEIDNKVLMVYRSSGLSGTGHKGEFLPFSGINTETNRFSSPTMGYIFKEMYYNKRWLNHRKNLDSFPYATDIMSEIKEVLSNTYPRKHKEHTTILEMYAFIKRTSRELNKVIKGREFFDLCTADENK